jgi:hypothetical protein
MRCSGSSRCRPGLSRRRDSLRSRHRIADPNIGRGNTPSPEAPSRQPGWGLRAFTGWPAGHGDSAAAPGPRSAPAELGRSAGCPRRPRRDCRNPATSRRSPASPRASPAACLADQGAWRSPPGPAGSGPSGQGGSGPSGQAGSACADLADFAPDEPAGSSGGPVASRRASDLAPWTARPPPPATTASACIPPGFPQHRRG